ncbi:MAG TPA: hypothetical protein PKI19_03375 [Elusimicrobiales bacterium]|nr:hypothetical protein [Elusimicrobiales bacterium]
MNKTVLFALPLVALMLAIGCKKQEAAPVEQPAVEQPAATEAAPAAVEAAPAATPAPETKKAGK